VLEPFTGAERAAWGTVEARGSFSVQSFFGIIAFVYFRKSTLSDKNIN